MERKLRNSFNLKGATTTSISSPQTPQQQQHLHHHGTRQRTAATTLQQPVYKSPVTTTTTPHIVSEPVQKNLNNNNNNEVSTAMTPAALDEQQQQQLAVTTIPAKPLSRNKNEEAINDLRTRIPEIENIFDIHSRIGNGTFSTVLLGTLKKEANLPENQRRKFAIKHHIPTSHPDRIMKELQCMAKIGGTDNVCGINCCIRYNESVAFIMPYLSHDRFHDFFSRMDVAEVQYYMKNLLIALRHVHRFNVIHRDVKPSNFLYNRRKRQFLLVDFGLAQQVAPPLQSVNNIPQSPVLLGSKAASMSAPGTAAAASEAKRMRENDDSHIKKSTDGNTVAVAVTGAGEVVSGNAKRLRCTGPADYQQLESVAANKASALLNSGSTTATTTNKTALTHAAAAAVSVVGATNDLVMAGINARKSGGGSVTMSGRLQQKLRAQGGAEASSNQRSSSVGGGAGNKNLVTQGSNGTTNASDTKYNTNRNLSSASGPKCFCYGNPQVCNICLVKKEIHASRAGTPGYRPPEVLLKYPDQTTAVDVWASGVIFLSILSSVYPFFKAPNDYVALAEMVTIFGDKAIRKTAFILDRLVTLSQKTRPLDLRKLCVRFRNRVKYSSPELLKKYQNSDGTCEVCKNCDQFYFNCLCLETSYVTEPIDGDDIYPASAYDLLYRLLEVNPHKRITAEEALKHPFFEECHNNNNNNNHATESIKSSHTTPSISLMAAAAAGDAVNQSHD
ncbi:cell division cycle 7-related protein kinase [Musca vetustissima]|uniref:cell division cycle 7-related protein kinase n=1 Tax=Musca vetustissima TaxID=27455 RepID=UPI002AB66E39|nr:cell division cycle 7-related protein kinase [Musca vetustissima]